MRADTFFLPVSLQFGSFVLFFLFLQDVLLSDRHIMKGTVQYILERYNKLSGLYYCTVQDPICGGVLIHLVTPVFLQSALFSYLFLRN